MVKKLILSLLILITALSSFSQERKKLITGIVKDSLGVVKNANIINEQTKQGTNSSDQGLFRIFVSVGDSLRVSSIQHDVKKIMITEKIFNGINLDIILKQKTYKLDEFDLKRNDLLGRLGIDVKDVPENVKDSLLRAAMDFSNINFNAPDNTLDEIQRAKPPIVNTMAGAMPMAGAGAQIGIPFKHSQKLWALRKKLEQKKNFPYKILSELGDQFFFDELKIPIENYFHFLEYCNPLGIEDMYKDGRTLEIIKILKRESKSYLKIIEEK